MKQLTVTLFVDPACATRAGRSSVGEHTLTLTDADLATLTDDQRDTLARHVAGERCRNAIDWGRALTSEAPPIAEATVTVLAALLDVRRATITEQLARDAEKRAAEESAWQATLENVLAAARTAPILKLRNTSLYGVYRNEHGSWSYNAPRANEPAAQAVGREQELIEATAAEAAAKQAADAEVEARTQARVAAETAQCEEILIETAPEMVEVWRAGRADPKAVRRVMARYLRTMVGQPPRLGRLTDATRDTMYHDADKRPLTPEEFATLRDLEKRATDLRDLVPTKVTTVVAYSYRPALEDEAGDKDGEVEIVGPTCAEIRARIGGHDVTIRTPLA